MTGQRSSSSFGGDKPRSDFASPKVILAAVLLGIVVLAGIWVVVTSGSKEQGVPEAAPSAMPTVVESTMDPVPSPTPSEPASEAESVCGLTAGDATVPTATLLTSPVAVGDALTVPSIEGTGPGITDGISHCFAHTPSGAVLAAANFMTWFSSMQQLDGVVDELMAPSIDRENLAEQIAASWGGQTGSPSTIHGFTYESRGGDDALVTLAVSRPGFPDDLVAWPLRLTWADGDWKIVTPSNGAWGETVLPGLLSSGFIEWRP